MTDEERGVVEANASFYAAFRQRDVDGMQELWAQEHRVAVIHPGWPALHGRRAVLESWERILRGPAPPDVACSEAQPYVMGEVAFVICRESLPGGALIATNVFARERSAWKLVHHQAGPTPALSEDPAETVH